MTVISCQKITSSNTIINGVYKYEFIFLFEDHFSKITYFVEVSTGIAQTVALCYVSSQDGGKQEVNAMVQDSVKSSLTQLGVIPQDAPTQSLTRKIPILGLLP